MLSKSWLRKRGRKLDDTYLVENELKRDAYKLFRISDHLKKFAEHPELYKTRNSHIDDDAVLKLSDNGNDAAIRRLVATHEFTLECRFHAFEIAHNLDRNSTGRGLRQFKTSLLQRLEQDEETTIRRRKEQSDVRELRRVYHAYKEYIIRHRGAFDLEHSSPTSECQAVYVDVWSHCALIAYRSQRGQRG
ncbi:hypothetical protein ACFE04_029518 [Oxalis oulophora]